VVRRGGGGGTVDGGMMSVLSSMYTRGTAKMLGRFAELEGIFKSLEVCIMREEESDSGVDIVFGES
jgi:hypothetical protein